MKGQQVEGGVKAAGEGGQAAGGVQEGDSRGTGSHPSLFFSAADRQHSELSAQTDPHTQAPVPLSRHLPFS